MTTHTTALIPLADNDGTTAVMGRDLHKFLEVKARYNDWFRNMIAYGFTADQDFITEVTKTAGQPGYSNLSSRKIDHIMSMDMAKEISMIQRTDKGKQARQYFIDIEKQHRSAIAPTVTPQAPALPATYIEALEALLNSEKEKQALTQAAEIASPKVEAFDAFIDAEGEYSMGTAAKMLELGRTTFCRLLRDAGILINGGTMHNTPYQLYAHHFTVKATTLAHECRDRNGNPYIQNATHYVTYVRPSGINYLRKRLNNGSLGEI